MSAYDGSLKFDTKVNTKGFNAGTKQINSQVNNLSAAFKKLGAVIGVAFAVKGLIKLGNTAVDLASDLIEVQNVVDTAFGNTAYKAEGFAKISIEQFGLSKLAAKQFSSTYMAMGRGMGLAMETSSDMAIETTKRIGDVASFYNKSFSEVDTMMKSIWTGETESLKQIGVVMTETNLQAFALTQGIKKQLSAMTQAEKTQLRYAFVMEQTKLAAGDFAKTSDSWANQTRILSERWKEFLSIIGTGLIQVLAPMVKFLNAVMSKLIEFANTFSAVTAQLFGKQTKITTDSKSIEAAAKAQGDFADETERAGKAAKGSLASFDEINNLAQNDDTGTSAGSTVGWVTSVAPTVETTEVESQLSEFTLKIQELLKPLQDISFDNLKIALENLKEAAGPLTETLFAGLKWALDNIFIPLSKLTIEYVIPAFLNTLATAMRVLNVVLENAKPIITGVAIAFATWKLIEFANYVKYIGALTNTTGFSALLNAIQQLAFVGFNGLKTAVLGIITPIKNVALSMFSVIKNAGLLLLELGKQTFALIANIAQWIWHAICVGASTIAQTAMTVATAAWNAICIVATAVTTAFGAAVAFLTSPIGLVILAIGAVITIVVLLIKHWDDVKKAASWCWDKIKEIWSIVANWFDTFIIKPLGEFFSNLWDDIKTLASNTWIKIKEVWNAVAAWFDTYVIKPVAGFFKSLWDGISSAAVWCWDSIKHIFSRVSKWFSTYVTTPVSNGFKNTINFLIGMVEGFINAFVKGINVVIGALNRISVNVPDWVPGFGGSKWGFNIPVVQQLSIPKLARGGIVDSPTIAMIGERGKEAVVPLENTAFVDTLAGALGNAVMTAMQFVKGNDNKGGDIILQLDGTTFARLINPYSSKENGRLGNKLIIETT